MMSPWGFIGLVIGPGPNIQWPPVVVDEIFEVVVILTSSEVFVLQTHSLSEPSPPSITRPPSQKTPRCVWEVGGGNSLMLFWVLEFSADL